MSLAKLMLNYSAQHAGLIQAVEGVSVDVQVILSSCDGKVATEERNVLAVNAQFYQDPERVERRIDARLAEIEEVGFDAAQRRVIDGLVQILNELPEEVRGEVSREVLRAGLKIVVADKEVSEGEEHFVLKCLAPALGIAAEEAKNMLAEGQAEIDQERAYVEMAFELYLLMVDGDDIIDPEVALRETIPVGFLGAVRTLVTTYSMQSEAAVNYFLSGLGGLSVASDYPKHCMTLSDLAGEYRQGRVDEGAQARIDKVRARVDHILDEGEDLFALDEVANHLTSLLGIMEEVSDEQRAFFRESLAPAFDMDVDELEEMARNVGGANPTLYQNLTGKTFEG